MKGFPDWHTATLVCALRGHMAPARQVSRLREEDRHLGIDSDLGRLARCWRCDAWLLGDIKAEKEDLGDLEGHLLPRRGKELRDAVVLRLIALNKALHAAGFFLAALALLSLDLKLGGLKDRAADLLKALNQSGQPSSETAAHWLDRFLGLDHSSLRLLLAGALAYCCLETVEAVGLWQEKRWAEYLTVIATAGLIPLEVYELIEHVTPFRLSALIINLAIVAWLIWAKRLFGARGGHSETPTFTAADLSAGRAPRA